ncbi:VanZ like family protein [Actinokineospora alba]|uniref:VanZ like family protein n=1 Tax=Actinokineospora alba TaxID=504798 RepID=A0A1H0PLD7_9PSEU|nr:VanZ family protein [Actinokineospora alba]TDP65835.1 VanZ like protein [Actinokineospora alba]SDI64060.1 VanZ like family protein [Actinokineospora alba]SDP05439.1 VanZ like family protein [Actinokineospora alba]
MSMGQDADLAERILNQPLVAAAMVAGCVVIGFVALVLARWRGWRRVPAVLAGFGLALALAVTLGRSGVLDPDIATLDPLRRCVENDFALASTKQRLNFYMLMPFAFFATLAIRRAWPVMIACAVLSAGIELTQALIAVGICDSQDFYNNTVGGLIAVVAAWGIDKIVSTHEPDAATARR